MNINYILPILFLLIICIISIKNTHEGYNGTIGFPYRKMRDEKGNVLPIVCLTAFFRDAEAKNLYYKLIKDNLIIGCTAYKTFPVPITDESEDKFHLKDDFDYVKEITNWLCCFKDPSKIFTSNNKILDVSESDFYDGDYNDTEKKYDFIYICNKDSDSCPLNGWNAINRNYDLALKCFPIMFDKYNMKGLIVGREHCGLEEKYKDNVTITGFLQYYDLQQKMRESKFLFVPNIYDASPRVVSECIVKNVPVLMNKNIVCGFKYINYETGEFFSNEVDIIPAIDKLYSRLNKINPRKWFDQYYGRANSGAILRNFLYSNTLQDEKYKHVNSILAKIKEVHFVI
jgi:hypothetical protein